MNPMSFILFGFLVSRDYMQNCALPVGSSRRFYHGVFQASTRRGRRGRKGRQKPLPYRARF